MIITVFVVQYWTGQDAVQGGIKFNVCMNKGFKWNKVWHHMWNWYNYTMKLFYQIIAYYWHNVLQLSVLLSHLGDVGKRNGELH